MKALGRVKVCPSGFVTTTFTVAGEWDVVTQLKLEALATLTELQREPPKLTVAPD